jgi:hypothetical protein
MLGAALSGCGSARKLTTQRRTYRYTVELPPAPANTSVHGQIAVDEEVQDTYRRYHGGVDWTRLAYRARNSSSVQPATMKLYVSLSDAVPAGQLDQQATLVETIALAPSEDRTITLEQAATNEPLRAFLADALSRLDVDTVHFYVSTSSSDPIAMVTVDPLTTQVRVHGSYF